MCIIVAIAYFHLGFPTTQLQLRNPYFHVFVLGVNSSGRQTKPSDDPLHPVVEETFLFDVGGQSSTYTPKYNSSFLLWFRPMLLLTCIYIVKLP